ncbi:MAG TPA: DUF4388 domain-containing protein [Planctomycetota bacterium]|nr:DUF4388 domain-containing protein [Planctomycetota bacterium]
MSFQGDVAGLGLGELLQGLARGGREGVLTLYGGGLSATLGVLAGQIHLLPESDEDPELWRKRCGRAWPDDDNERVDALRMVEIAYAARLERMFELLDCEGVHFRFEPGPLPCAEPAPVETPLETAVERTERPEPRVPIYCAPISVEFLLLEHARLADECSAHGDSSLLSIHEVPCPLAPVSTLPGDKLFAQCDGASNVGEISDRLSWPLRQTKAAVFAHLANETVRLASANELAALTREELVKNRFLRAASRLSGWAQNATPGVPDAGEAELLIDEWNGGKLVLALAGCTSSDTRTVLRRMELAEADPKASLARWREICKHHRHDLVAEVHVLRLGLALEDESQKPGFGELLKVARHFQEQGRLLRAGAMLSAAATRNPEGTANRLELGNRMLACGLVAESRPWLLDACRALVQSGLADKALAPLRALVASDPADREARSLFNVARARSTEGKAKLRNLWIALASVLVLALVALVQMRSDLVLENQLVEIESSSQPPELLLRKLETDFAESRNLHVLDLKRKFSDALRKRESVEREAWLAKFSACQAECESGDPLLGLQRTLDLEPPPKLALSRELWPTVSDVLQALAGRLEQSVGELSSSTDFLSPGDNSEKRLALQVRDLIALGESKQKDDALEGFVSRLRHLLSTLHDRDEERAAAITAAAARANADQQEQLLAAARAHAKDGDLERAAKLYKQLIETDVEGHLKKALTPEITALEEHLAAVVLARDLARGGRHVDAIEALKRVCPSPWEHLLPWRVETAPAGARLRFADGTVRVTPCTVETAPQEPMDFTLELAGFEPLSVHSDGPKNVAVAMSRLPDRWWRTSARIEAPPVALQDDHLLADRQGNVVRLGEAGTLRWEHSLHSLSGVARAPVFLPGRAGSLLCLTEDGSAWIVDSTDGRLEGPWEVGAPPIAGPYAQGDRVRARFADGREAVWDTRLKPELSEPAAAGAPLLPAEAETVRGGDGGLSLMRYRDVHRGAEHRSRWTDWTIEIQDEVYLVHDLALRSRSFTVRRQGDWSYVAWEAPNVKTPQGRLWISDGAGVRAFAP